MQNQTWPSVVMELLGAMLPHGLSYMARSLDKYSLPFRAGPLLHSRGKTRIDWPQVRSRSRCHPVLCRKDVGGRKARKGTPLVIGVSNIHLTAFYTIKNKPGISQTPKRFKNQHLLPTPSLCFYAKNCHFCMILDHFTALAQSLHLQSFSLATLSF